MSAGAGWDRCRCCVGMETAGNGRAWQPSWLGCADRTEQRQQYLKWEGWQAGAGPGWRLWGGTVRVPDCCGERRGSMKEGHLLVSGPPALAT